MDTKTKMRTEESVIINIDNAGYCRVWVLDVFSFCLVWGGLIQLWSRLTPDILRVQYMVQELNQGQLHAKQVPYLLYIGLPQCIMLEEWMSRAIGEYMKKGEMIASRSFYHYYLHIQSCLNAFSDQEKQDNSEKQRHEFSITRCSISPLKLYKPQFPQQFNKAKITFLYIRCHKKIQKYVDSIVLNLYSKPGIFMWKQGVPLDRIQSMTYFPSYILCLFELTIKYMF